MLQFIFGNFVQQPYHFNQASYIFTKLVIFSFWFGKINESEEILTVFDKHSHLFPLFCSKIHLIYAQITSFTRNTFIIFLFCFHWSDSDEALACVSLCEPAQSAPILITGWCWMMYTSVASLIPHFLFFFWKEKNQQRYSHLNDTILYSRKVYAYIIQIWLFSRNVFNEIFIWNRVRVSEQAFGMLNFHSHTQQIKRYKNVTKNLNCLQHIL